MAAGLLTAEEGFQRLSHYTDLPLLLEHLQTRRDCENLKALKWRLADWLQEEGKQVEDKYDQLSSVLVGAGVR